jgi:hypothetical protein
MINRLKNLIKNKYFRYFLEFVILILILILATGILSSGFAFVGEHILVILVLLIVIILLMGG